MGKINLSLFRENRALEKRRGTKLFAVICESSAKYIMRYFAIVDSFDQPKSLSRYGSQEVTSAGSFKPSLNLGQANTEIEEAVLSTNPIMEVIQYYSS